VSTNRALEAEYVQLRLADELDDVDMSLSTAFCRDRRIAEIEEKLDEDAKSRCERRIQRVLKNPKTHYCGGGLYNK